MGGRVTAKYKGAAYICAAERDHALNMDSNSWPEGAPPGWEDSTGVLSRIIESEKEEPKRIPAELEELILRFPSAPLHGFQRLHDHHVTLGASENFHTCRVLRSTDPEAARQRVSRIFLMHIGLNEWDRMGLYYRLASHLIKEEPTTACIVRPFPGHLTRYPFQLFAEMPLDYYLRDGSHLFRQFLRFMIETRWFLSAIVRRSSFRCASGADLLAEKDEIAGSRLDTGSLAEKMRQEWIRLHDASTETAAMESEPDQPKRPPVNEEVADQEQFEIAIDTLRGTLGLGAFPKRNGDLEEDHADSEPKLHALGYSLGGFTAQSVFMSWPFLFSSCSTLLAGGPLRELAPIGFADPEEWQTVLHSLRYELDDRLMSKHLGVDRDSVAGIDHELFVYLKRTFYEVFQQDYRGSIQTRYEAYRERMLFIVGGDDPVVRPESVLQSGPKGGLNLLEIGGLGHFFKDSGGDHSDKHQRTFWLPEMAMLIHHFSDNAAKEHDTERPFTWFDEDLAEPELTRMKWNEEFLSIDKDADQAKVRSFSPSESIAIETDGSLPGELFERCLDDLLYRVSEESNGLLFVLRNEIPTALLPPEAVREAAGALYHDDFSIVRYCHGVTARREVLEKSLPRICLVLPWNARNITRHMDLRRGYPSQAESAGGMVADRLTPEDVWENAMTTCFELAKIRENRQSIRVFDGNQPVGKPGGDHELVIEGAKKFAGNEEFDRIPSLPDCWVWVSTRLLTQFKKKRFDIDRGIRLLTHVVSEEGSSEEILQKIREEDIRIVNVSRARYNPRFRGRLLVDGSAARKRLTHAALCLAMSKPIHGLDRDVAFPESPDQLSAAGQISR